jgi:hypothetical protein
MINHTEGVLVSILLMALIIIGGCMGFGPPDADDGAISTNITSHETQEESGPVQDDRDIPSAITGGDTVTVHSEGGMVYAVSSTGEIIQKGTAGIDDGRVIQGAIDFIDRGTVILKAGIYTLTGPTVSPPRRGNICIDKPDIHLKGEGDATILRSGTMNDEYAICVWGYQISPQPTNVTISDLRIESVDGGGYGGIWICYADWCRVQNVTVRNMDPHSMIAQEGVYVEGDNNLITNCTFEGLKAHAVNIQGAMEETEPRHHHNRFDTIQITNCHIGIKVGYQRGPHSNTFTNVNIDTCWQGISVRAGASNNVFENIAISTIITDAIRIAEGYPSNNTFKHIRIEDGGQHDAIMLGGESGQYNTFQNVTVNGYQGNAVQALEGGRYNTFDTCTFTGNRGGIVTAQDALSIIHCTFDHQQFGVSITPRADGTKVEGCYFGDHLGSDLIDRGTNTVVADSRRA